MFFFILQFEIWRKHLTRSSCRALRRGSKNNKMSTKSFIADHFFPWGDESHWSAWWIYFGSLQHKKWRHSRMRHEVDTLQFCNPSELSTKKSHEYFGERIYSSSISHGSRQEESQISQKWELVENDAVLVANDAAKLQFKMCKPSEACGKIPLNISINKRNSGLITGRKLVTLNNSPLNKPWNFSTSNHRHTKARPD